MAKALSLRWKLPLLVGGLMALLTGAAVLGAWYEVRQANLRVARERLATVTAQIARQLEAQARGYLDRAEELAASSPVVSAATPGGVVDTAALAATMLAENVFAAEVLGADGRVIWEGGQALAAVRRLEAQSLRDSRFGGEGRAIGILQAVGDTLTFPVVAVVRDGEQRLGYAVRWMATRPNPEMPAAVASLVGLGARLFVGSPGGAWSDQAEVTDPPPEPPESLDAMRIYRRGTTGQQLAVGAMVETAPWMIVTEFPLATVLAPASAFLQRAVLGAAVLLLAGGLIGVWAMRRITTPLTRLTVASDRMAAGERDVHVPVRGGDELARLGQSFNEMAQRVQSEVAARIAAEDQWRILFKANPLPMWVFDRVTLEFLAVNDAAIERYGWTREEFLTMRITDIRPTEDVDELRHQVSGPDGGSVMAIQWRHRDRHGEVFAVEVSSTGVVFNGRDARLVMAHDISRRAALEEQLRQAQKMEAVGRLAGGVAHDFNNNLAVISACAEMAISDLAAAGQDTENVEEILRATNQAHSLTRQLLAFSRQQVTRPVVLDPNEIVLGVERMINRIIGEDVRIVVRTAPTVAPVRIDPGGLEQVLLNLAVNARDALPHGGEVTIATGVTEVDHDSMEIHGLQAAGTYVVLTVSDNGTGMPPEVRSRIFDPFFTTKAPGKGTGLGLATAFGIVTAAGGAISVYSELGVGSTFRVYLPRVSEDLGARSGPVVAALADLPRGSETVLLVEDDVAVRSITASVLARLGYHVVEADGPAAALAVAADRSVRIDLVLSDVVMPGLSGPRLVEELRAQRPGLAAILMSGYAGDAVQSRGVEASQLPFIEKPFAVATLATTLRTVLDAA